MNDPMPPTILKEIASRHERATPGPWKSFVEGRDHASGSNFIRTAGEDIYLTGASIADQDFIANAHQDVPALIREVRRLRARLGEPSN